MIVLGLESSCDETAVALLSGGREVIAARVRTQVEDHAPWGGVVPELAAMGHQRAVVNLMDEVLGLGRAAGVGTDDIDAVAVTARPGLIGSLLIGLGAAKAAAWTWGVPLVAVDHVRAHAWSATIENDGFEPPFACLVVSGGHTSLYHVDGPDQIEPLGSTRDDAAGEAFDKVAALLGLGYPGGPALSRAAEDGDPAALHLPRPLLEPGSLDFSFSGLKTAVRYAVKGVGDRAPMDLAVADVAASFQEAVCDVLVEKCRRALDATGLERLAVAGGVACNVRLRQRLAEAFGDEHLALPSPGLCTDNAVMIAALGSEMAERGLTSPLSVEASARGLG